MHVTKFMVTMLLLTINIVANAKEISDHHYEQTKANLDTDVGERLQEWMDEQKLNTSHVEIDFEKMDQQSGTDSTAWFSKLCKEAD